jgi:two-component system, NarL family, sensor histidine kinase DesK
MPPIDTRPIDEPPMDEPPMDDPPMDDPPMDEPPTDKAGQRRPVGLADLAERDRGAFARRWWLLAGIWLVYLIDPLVNLWRYDSIAQRVLGTGLIVVFSAVYIVMVPRAFGCPPRLRAAVLGTMVGTSALYFAFCGDGSAFAPYLAVVVILLLPWSSAVPLVLALTAAVTIGPGHVAAWHDSGFQWGVGLGTLFASIIVGAMRLFAGTTGQLHRAEEEIEKLAAEQERLRIARDLHDLLGHALTTVTLKAELASRLVARDPERAAAEMAEVAQLGRQSLADVRAAVSGFREVSLVKELAAAREVLQAAGIEAELPAAAEDVPGDLRELFGWVVREGVTNAVRHSRARRVAVRVEGRVIEIDNDGVEDGPGDAARARTTGHGLIGLSERVAMVGGEVRAGPQGEGGYRLRVEVPA